MLSRPGPLPSGSNWLFEVKWDGFHAIVSTEDGLRVSSRRGWDMTHTVPELEAVPPGLVLDGELVAWRDGDPYFPDVCARVLNRDLAIAITLIVFDVLRIDGESLLGARFDERHDLLVGLPLRPPVSMISETFADGEALFSAVCEMGLEGVVAKRIDSTYGTSKRGWIKKNPTHWRRDLLEREATSRKRERARARLVR